MGGCVQSYEAAGNVKYTYAQLQGLWNQAGGNPQAAPTAAAVAMAESGGNSTATCVDSNGSTDRGLWQINSVHGSQSTYDVAGNTRAAIAISNNGSNWSAWTTYTSGAYRQYLSGAPADSSAPINATNAAANQPQQATDTSLFCNSLTQAVSPWFCVGDQTFFGGIAQKAIDYAILQTIKIVLNPFLAYFGGVIGVASGGTLIILGIFAMISGSKAGRETIGTGVSAGAIVAGQPELAAAGAPVGSARVARRAATVQQQRRQPSTRPRDQLRAEVATYNRPRNGGSPWGAPAQLRPFTAADWRMSARQS